MNKSSTKKEGHFLKRFVLLVFIVEFFFLSFASRGKCQQIFQTVQIASSPNPVGSGARAQGMGGAFIAVADDATAASWNPAGLMQLERPEISFVLSYTKRRKNFDSSIHPEASGMNEKTRYDLNYLSFAYPFRACNKNMIISLNYQRLYDFYDELDFDFNYRGFLSDGSFFNVQTRTHFTQTGGLKAFSPAYAVQITPRFSAGITLNLWTNNLGYNNEWKQKRKTTATAFIHTPNHKLLQFQGTSLYEEENKNFEGVNVNIGFIYQLNSIITLGAVLKTPFTADIDREVTASAQFFPTGTPPPPINTFRKKEGIEMRFPLSYGAAIALRFSDRFTAAVDVYRTRWSDFWIKDSKGSKTSPITGRLKKDTHIHDTTQVRIGCEYLFVLEKTIIPLRFGLFYDPEPSEANPEDFMGVSCGTGIMLDSFVLDWAYIYRWGRDVKGDTVGIAKTRADVDQHTLLFSMIYHF